MVEEATPAVAAGKLVQLSGGPSAYALSSELMNGVAKSVVSPRSANPAGEAATFVLREQVHSAFATALRLGVPARVFLDMVSADARSYIEEDLREGYATPEEGLAELLTAEGGCVEASEARMLFHKPNGVSRQAISERIRAGELIAYRSGGDRWVLPVWQFRPQGGLLKGLPEVLRKIREKIPHGGELFPFTFFLQADPVCDGRTPLQALRDGDVDVVLRAVDGFVG
jgi:hypothetical protein